jgi:hypothetical protein
MEYAEEILQSNVCPLYKEAGVIHESYNGQVSALGVSTLMIGLKATLAVYYQDKPSGEDVERLYKRKAYRRCLLEVIVKMLNLKNGTTYTDAFDFLRNVMPNNNTPQQEEQWKSDVVNCSVALKQVIRTYKLG